MNLIYCAADLSEYFPVIEEIGNREENRLIKATVGNLKSEYLYNSIVFSRDGGKRNL